MYRFLIAWIDGSESAFASGVNPMQGGRTDVKTANDLTDTNECVSVYEFSLEGEAENFAWEIGASYAFNDNFTAFDTVSKVQKLVKEDAWPHARVWVDVQIRK